MVATENSRIRVHFDFSGHATKEDADRLKSSLRDFKPHVVALESAFGFREFEDFYYRKLTWGERWRLLTGSKFTRGLFRALRRHKISRVIELERGIATSQGEKLQVKHSESSALARDATALFLFGKPSESIDLARSAVNASSEVHRAREEAAKRLISNLGRQLVQQFPELKQEDEIRVLVKYGTSHTPLYKHALRSGFKSVTRSMQTPTYFDPFGSLTRAGTFGLGEKTSREDLAKAIFSRWAILYGVKQLKLRGMNAAALGNLVARQITLDQFNRISRTCAGMIKTRAKNHEIFFKAAEQEGIKLPKSRKEAHTFLQQRGVKLAFHH